MLPSGSWFEGPGFLAASFRGGEHPAGEDDSVGFRVARPDPAPIPVPFGDLVGPAVAVLLALAGLLGFAYGQNRKGQVV